MSENGKQVPVSVYCDLIEREIRKALEDLAVIRDNETRKLKVRAQCILLRSAMSTMRHYLREMELSVGGES